MRARPPHYFQATESSCVPACLRMVLAYLGHEVPEITLRLLCECDDDGTQKSKAIECAKQYGFLNSFSAYLHLEELIAELGRGLYPIVYLQPFEIVPQNQHSVVVIEMHADIVLVLDPHWQLGGERELKADDFNRAWRATNGLTLIIE